MNDFDEYVDEDNVDEILEKAVEEIQKEIDEDNYKESIIGIQAFHFKLRIVEDSTTNIILIILFNRFIGKVELLKGRGLYLLLPRMPRETSGEASIVLFFILLGCFFVFCFVVLFWVWNGWGDDVIFYE